MRGTRAEISIPNLKSNIKNIKSFTKSKLCVAVKANAYGHGAVECAKAVLEAGADFLAVATVEEGEELRNSGINAPVIMLSLCTPEEISDCIRFDISPFVFDKEYISLLNDECIRQNKKNFPVHLAVDSGMGRIGCFKEEAAELAQYISDCSNIFLQGTATHFANSDVDTEEGRLYTEMQFRNFFEAIENIKKAGLNPGICHCSNSAASIYLPQYHLDMVRSGITCYGYYAGDFTKDRLLQAGINLELKPVMTFKSKVCSIRHIKKGMSIGYGSTWTADKDTNIAVLTAGYADGMLRKFGQAGIKITIAGKSYPIRGRICMDQCMVDIGDDNIQRWEDAIIFGENGAENAESIAQKTGTISYEITSCITSRVERVFIK